MKAAPGKSFDSLKQTFTPSASANQLESGGILVSRAKGRTRLYTFNPRYPFLKESKEILDKALSFYPKNNKRNLS